MKKMLLPFGLLTAAFFVSPSTGSAKLVLDMPPILAGATPKVPCEDNAACAAAGLSFCCNGLCYAAGQGYCCDNQHYTTGNGFCCGNTHYATGEGFCCGDQHYTTGFCCENEHRTTGFCCKGIYSSVQCSTMNDTGITWSGNYPSGNNTDCSGANSVGAQDCSHGRNTFEFASVAGGCVEDKVTGLTWSPDQNVTPTWDNVAGVAAAANTNSLCGYTNWRVPSIKELVGIVSYNRTTPAADSAFSSIQSSFYWTGTPAASSTNAWTVSFDAGITFSFSKGSFYRVILVRGEEKAPNFVDKGDGTVADKANGLMWKKCLEGLSGDSCTSGSAATTFTWAAALQQPGTVNTGGFAGYTNWRLPNIKELQSIVKESQNAPALDTTKFPNIPVGGSQVWSSSPHAGTNSKSWMVDFGSGIVNTPLSRESTLHVRLVRDCTDAECY
jgi:hypothetical protein